LSNVTILLGIDFIINTNCQNSSLISFQCCSNSVSD
jgi:hypothetical protein